MLGPALTLKLIKYHLIEGNLPISLQYLLKSGNFTVIFPRNVFEYCVNKVREHELTSKILDLPSSLEKLEELINVNQNIMLSDPFEVSIQLQIESKKNPLNSLTYVHLALASHHEAGYYICSKSTEETTRKTLKEFNASHDKEEKFHFGNFCDFFQERFDLKFEDMATDRKDLEFYFINPKIEKEKVFEILPDLSVSEALKVEDSNEIIPKEELIKRFHLSQYSNKKLVHKILLNEREKPQHHFEIDPDFENVLVEWKPMPSISRIHDVLKTIIPLSRKKFFLDSTYIAHLLEDFQSEDPAECERLAELADSGIVFTCLSSTLKALSDHGYESFIQFMLKNILNLPKMEESSKMLKQMNRVIEQKGLGKKFQQALNTEDQARLYVQVHAIMAELLDVDALISPSGLQTLYCDQANMEDRYGLIQEMTTTSRSIPIKSIKSFYNENNIKKNYLVRNKDSTILNFLLFEDASHKVIERVILEKKRELSSQIEDFWSEALEPLSFKEKSQFKMDAYTIHDQGKKVCKNLAHQQDKNNYAICSISNLHDYKEKVVHLVSELSQMNQVSGFLHGGEVHLLFQKFEKLVGDHFVNRKLFTPPFLYGLDLNDKRDTRKLSFVDIRSLSKTHSSSRKDTIQIRNKNGRDSMKLQTLLKRFFLIKYQFHGSQLNEVYQEFIQFVSSDKKCKKLIEDLNFENFKQKVEECVNACLGCDTSQEIYYSLLLEQFVGLVRWYHDRSKKTLGFEEASRLLEVPLKHLELLVYSLVKNNHLYKVEKHVSAKFSLFFDKIKIQKSHLQYPNANTINTLVPFFLSKEKKVSNRSDPDFWIITFSEMEPNPLIFLLSKEKGIQYSNRLFDIELKANKFATFVDTGAFSSLMSRRIANELFPEQKRYKILVSGYTQNASWRYIIKDIPFTFQGVEFKTDFLLDENLESIFKSEVVLGYNAFDKLLLHFYGKSMKTLFEPPKLNLQETLNEKKERLKDLISLKERYSNSEHYTNFNPIENRGSENASLISNNQLLVAKKRNHSTSGIITRKFALIPEGDKEERLETISDIREQFLKFRDLENIYSQFLVDLVKSDPSIIKNKPWEYPNFHLSITKAHRAQFKDLKENGRIKQEETLPSDGKIRIRKYFYNYYSDPSDPARNLSRFNTNYRKKEQFIERANQNALQYPFYAVRNWIIRNERLKTITDTIIGLLSSQQKQKIYYRKTQVSKSIQIDSYMMEHFLGGKSLHWEVLKQFSDDTRINIFGEPDNPSHEYISGHIKQLRNIILKKGTLEATVRSSINTLITQTVQDPSIFEILFEGIINDQENVKNYFLKQFIRLMKLRTTRCAQIKLKKGTRLYGNSFEVSFVNHLFDTHEIWGLNQFKKIRDAIINEESFLQSNYFEQLSLKKVKENVRDKLIQFLQAILSNSDHIASKAIFKPSFPKIHINSFTFEGFSSYLTTKLFYEVKSRLPSLLKLSGELTKVKKLLIDDLHEIKTRIYDLTSPPKFKKLSIPMVQPEYMYEFDGNSLIAKFGMIKKKGKEHDIHLSPHQRDRFKKLYDPHFEFRERTQQFKNNLHNPILKMESRKLILCQPFKIKMDDATDISQRGTAARIEVGVDLGIKHFAVLSVMDKTAPNQPTEIGRYFLGQKALYDFKFNDMTGKFIRNAANNHATNIKLRLIRLHQEQKKIQRLKAEYENRHQVVFQEKIKHFHRSKSESMLWNKIHVINSDIVARLSGLIVRIARYHGAQVIRFEDLRWSRHQPKKEKGKFIAFWQIHWFHSQVQSKTAQNASRSKIRAVVVDAFLSSHTCSKCNIQGIRSKSNSKLFHCPHCKTILDADLNAARNIAKRDTVKILSISHSPEYLCSVDGFQ